MAFFKFWEFGKSSQKRGKLVSKKTFFSFSLNKTLFLFCFWTFLDFWEIWKRIYILYQKNYFIYLFRPWKPCGASRSNGPRSKGQKSSHPMPWTAFGKSWTIKTFIMNQTSLISKQNLWISRMIWHHRKGNIYKTFSTCN